MCSVKARYGSTSHGMYSVWFDAVQHLAKRNASPVTADKVRDKHGMRVALIPWQVALAMPAVTAKAAFASFAENVGPAASIPD